MQLFLVPKERVNDLWAQVEHYVASYVKHSSGRYTVNDVQDLINDGTFQLWVAVDGEAVKAAAMTVILQFPQLKEIQLIMCAGSEREDWFHFVKRIEDYARETGVKLSSAISRIGWRKDMRSLGYQHTHDYLEKVL